ncbi:ABC transporter permease [Sphingobacterium paludis]|uniref:Putative ABC transport system permease protein n=1 Tax=Sphingobacterium paludis TaxID=1476465 RepID=A0A4R7DA68_9SPHI|nr:FtsX-like permease family protein [Sphingobacterium paludis]TDS15956.1 putative ABC transport system permease protein [Sphingobacterium paludis]
MIKNDIKIAWRNLRNQKLFSIIKIGGFAFGIAVSLLIALFVQHELSYDKFYPEADQIFRLVGVAKQDNVVRKGISLPAPAGPTFKEEFPAIEAMGRMLSNPLFGAGTNQLSTNENPENFSDNGFTYVDQSLLDMLPLQTVFGSLTHALDEPNSIVITKSKAEKYFKGDPIGKIIYLNNDEDKPYTIHAVIEDVPSNSHLYGFDFFMTLSGIDFYPGEQQNWVASNYSTYIKVKKETNTALLAEQLTKSYVNDHYIPAMLQAGMQVNPILHSAKFVLQPLENIHLHSTDIQDYKIETQKRGDIKVVWIFAGIASFILIIAAINFINLSTANASTRAKEVGVRKTIGSSRKALISQFITESLLYSVISVLLGIAISFLLLPIFNNLADKNLHIPWNSWYFIPSTLLATTALGLLSGIYPALFLSGFKPIAVLKGKVSPTSGSSLFRNGLVVFQFATSIMLIIGTLIINQQLNFILNKDVGFNKDQVLVLHGTTTLGNQAKTFKDELNNIPAVQSVAISDYIPVNIDGSKRNGNSFNLEGKQQEEAGKGGQFWVVDKDYIATFGLNLIAGRNFNMAIASDSAAVIVNQKMVQELGIKDPIGAHITNGNTYTIIGVVEDFIFGSLREEGLDPLCLAIGGSNSLISIKIKTTDPARTIDHITKVWDKFSPQQKIQYSFLDEGFAALYNDVQRTQQIFTAFAIITIFIACLGLFGLAAYTTAQRTKEIGVRKVLGASVAGIIQLLSFGFLKLVLLALLIATPIAWWAMHVWLQDFSYRTEVKWWVFVLTGGMSLLIAMGTICYHAIRTARMNPVSSLRDE